MAIQEGPDTHNEKAVKTDWPVEEGLTGGTQKQTGDRWLHPEGINGVKSIVASKDSIGLGEI